MITALQYIGFTSVDPDEWRTFGPEILGAELAAGGPDSSVRLRLDDADYRIAIHPGDADAIAYMGWGVEGPADLAALSARLVDAGVKVEDGSPELLAERSVQGLITFDDPLGFHHEAAWGQLTRPSSFRPGRAISGFVTGAGGLGHAVLIVPEIEAIEAFYTELLGFHLSDVVNMFGMNFRFYHCNQRHHTIALVPVPGMVGIHHLMVEVGSIDDVGTALEIVTEREIPVAMSLGRHVNDLMTSFYVRTPSGFEVEYGTGGLLVDPETWTAGSFEAISVWGHHPPPGGLLPGAAVRAYEEPA